MNPQTIQGPGTGVKFWGVMWSGKNHVVSETVIGKIQSYPISKMEKKSRLLWELLAKHCTPLSAMPSSERKCVGLGSQTAAASEEAKISVTQIKALRIS